MKVNYFTFLLSSLAKQLSSLAKQLSSRALFARDLPPFEDCHAGKAPARNNNSQLATAMTQVTLTIGLLFALFTHSAFAIENDAERFTRFTKEVRCIVCQNQSLADSNAPLANDLRNKISALIAEKKSDTEINEYLVKRYGEFILLRPRFNKSTVFLWLFPILALGFIIFYFLNLNLKKKD